MRRRQPVAVYRVIDEAELLGESNYASNESADRLLKGVDASSRPPRDASKPVLRRLRIAHGRCRLVAALLSASAVAIAGAWTISPPVTSRRRHSHVQRTSPRATHFQRRPARQARARTRALVKASERHLHRDSESSSTRASVNAATPGSVHVAVSAASSPRSVGQSDQQAAQEFGFER